MKMLMKLKMKGRRMLISPMLLKLMMSLQIIVCMEKLKMRMRMRKMQMIFVLRVSKRHMLVKEEAQMGHHLTIYMSTRVLLIEMHWFQSCGCQR